MIIRLAFGQIKFRRIYSSIINAKIKTVCARVAYYSMLSIDIITEVKDHLLGKRVEFIIVVI